MPLWSDDFNRADGPLGNDWSVKSGTWNISSGAAECTNNGVCVCGPASGPGAAVAEAVVAIANVSTSVMSPAVKMSATGSQRYAARAWNDGADLKFQITYNTGAGDIGGAGYTLAGGATSSGTLRIEYNGGTCRLYFNGTQYVTYNHSTLANNAGIGLLAYGSNHPVDLFTAIGDGTPQLFVTPAIVGTEDGDVPISLMATAVTWTAGTPGSPSFGVNAGALSGQVIDSTTNARAIFTPPATAQTVTITDPANGISDTITVVEGTYQGGGTGGMGGLSEAAVGWLEAQAAHGGLVLADNDETGGSVSGLLLKGAFGELLLGVKNTTTPPSGYLATADVIATIWHILNGGVEHTSESDVFQTVLDNKQLITDLAASFGEYRYPATYTIQDILDNLRGTGAYNHTDLKTAIDAIQGGDNQEVLDAIAAAQGDPLATIKAAIDLVYALGTTSNYDLADVQTWVQAVQGAGLPTVKAVVDKLALIQPTPAASIDTIRNDIAALGLVVVAVQTLLGTVNGTVTSIAEVATDILDIVSNLPTTVVPPQRPVWPGLANVTLGAEVALSNGLTIDGPLHGLLFTITQAAPRAQKYLFDTVTSWSRVGAVIFESDRGDFERSQTFSLDTQVIVPMTMEEAASAIIRLNTGWVGTVRPWLRAE